ncbi:uncharacterized protein LOC101858767 [Aplysia californica]|uniref:Uncharacterized protein LOC101858767 n=1 Tax=Aplysia californica TaxID=6500 RepID=A0ABM0JHX0_APLCA|nr:uncharacterized protein LOC101858767 [Aplysia californica]
MSSSVMKQLISISIRTLDSPLRHLRLLSTLSSPKQHSSCDYTAKSRFRPSRFSVRTRNMSTRAKKDLSFWQDNFKQWTVKDISVIQEPYSATLRVPGLTPESFNRYANPQAQSLLFVALSARVFMFHEPYNDAGDIFMDWARTTSDRLIFISSTEVSFSRALYDPEVKKTELDVKIKLGYVGNASVAMVTELYSPDNKDEPICSQVAQTVSIDKSTRKPTPFQDWFRDKFVGRGIRDRGLVIRPFERPENAFPYELKVRWSDTDGYNHVNALKYITFAEDAVHAALVHSESGEKTHNTALRGLTEDFLINGFKSMQISFQNESLEGENLVAYVWQPEEEDPSVVKCSIERNDQRICQLRFEYYD